MFILYIDKERERVHGDIRSSGIGVRTKRKPGILIEVPAWNALAHFGWSCQ